MRMDCIAWNQKSHQKQVIHLKLIQQSIGSILQILEEIQESRSLGSGRIPQVLKEGSTSLLQICTATKKVNNPDKIRTRALHTIPQPGTRVHAL